MNATRCYYTGGSYPVYFLQNGLKELGILMKKHGLLNKAFIITNSSIWSQYENIIVPSLNKFKILHEVICILSGEKAKNLKTTEELYERLILGGVDRSSCIVALGGGVVGDIAGYVAATLLRGIFFVQVPTTVISQSDSAIGGKVGVDHSLGKNLIGTFYHPEFVLADSRVITSLPDKEWRSGMAEIIKSAVIGSPYLFNMLEKQVFF